MSKNKGLTCLMVADALCKHMGPDLQVAPHKCASEKISFTFSPFFFDSRV